MLFFSMNILLVNTEPGFRGGERQVFLLAKALIARNHKVSVCCRNGEALHRRCLEAGVNVIAVRRNLCLVKILVGSSRRFDIISVHTGGAMSVLGELRPLLSAPLVYTRRMYVRKSSGRSYRKASQVVAVSPHVAMDIFRLTGIKAFVIPDAADPMKPDRARGELVLREVLSTVLTDGTAQPLIVTIAMLDESKDPLTGINAIAIVANAFPSVRCVHFGSGPMLKAAQKEIQALGIESNYILAGYHSGAVDAIAAANLFMLSSRSEAFGSTILDAFSSNVPVVTTDGGGLSYVVSGRGLAMPVGDAAALGKAIISMLSDTERLQACITAGKRAVEEEFSLLSIAKAYEDLFESLL